MKGRGGLGVVRAVYAQLNAHSFVPALLHFARIPGAVVLLPCSWRGTFPQITGCRQGLRAAPVLIGSRAGGLTD